MSKKGIYIEELSMCNWFNYGGDYSQNKISFKKGLNVISGNNNAGKTKIHSALKFILFGEILMEDEDGTPTEYDIKQIENVAIDIMNQKVFRSAKSSTKLKFGAKLIFIKKNTGARDDQKYLLQREVEFRKRDDNSIEKFESKEIVKLIVKGSEINTQNEFNEVSQILMPGKFRQYFFIEGEQQSMAASLQTKNLLNTINTIIPLKKIEDTVESAKKTIKVLNDEINTINKNSTKKDVEADKAREELNDLYENKEELDTKITDLKKQIESNKKKVSSLKDKFNKVRKSREVLQKYTELVNDVKNTEGQLEGLKNNFVDDTIGGLFYISKTTNNEKEQDGLNKLLEKLQTTRKQRQNELNASSEEEQDVLNKLIKNQPTVELLEEMIEEETCYFCSGPPNQIKLNDDQKKWINEVLIPFYKDETSEDDPILSNIEDTMNILKKFLNNSSIGKKFFYFNEQIVTDPKQKIEELIKILSKKKQDLQKFEDMHGKPGEVDNTFLASFSQTSRELEKNNKELGGLENMRKNIQVQIKKLEEKINEYQKQSGDIRLQELTKYQEFINDIKDLIEQKKSNIFNEFAEKLEIQSNKRLKMYMKSANWSDKTELKIIRDDEENEFEAKISGLYGEQKNQGQAATALIKVSIIFGLLNMLKDEGKKQSPPFIADAILSSLALPQIESFYNQLKEEENIDQVIIVTKDLIEDVEDEEDGIQYNKIGERLKETIDRDPNSQMLRLFPRENNTKVDIKI